MSMLLLISLAGKGQTLQAVTDNGNTTTKNIWIGALPSSGVTENALNLGGRLKLLGANAAYATGVEGEQPTIYRTGVNSLGYPFNGYNNLVLQTSTQNRDMLFVTGITPVERMVIKANGNVGIGTTNPIAPLDIFTNTSMFGLKIGDEANSNIRIAGTSGGATGYGSIQTYYGGQLGGVLVLQRDSGNVGIAIRNPKERLAVKGSMAIYSELDNVTPRPEVGAGTISGEIRGLGGGAANPSSNWDDGFLRLSAGGGSNAWTKSFIDLSGFISTSASNDPAVMDRSMNITMGTNGVERLRITTEGNIGIGTKKTGGHKLAVEGTIGARKLIVSQSTWADFVFHPSYALPALQEVETFIKEHQHLPGIPSEAVIKAEGLDVGDMNKKLLQKVEELTLYMIDMQKRQALLETENNELKGRIKHLENRE